jgi:predicted transcriptional regulator
MRQPTIRVSERTRETLSVLAHAASQTMGAVLDQAVEAYRRNRFLEDVNAAYAVLRDDPSAWAELEAERSAWDSTLADGLPDESVPVREIKEP